MRIELCNKYDSDIIFLFVHQNEHPLSKNSYLTIKLFILLNKIIHK
jgi:hypothetical protein